MRNKSPAKRAASSPPVPARISRMALLASAASFGSNASRIVVSRSGQGLRGLRLLGFGQGPHLIVERRLDQHGFDPLDLGLLVAIGPDGRHEILVVRKLARQRHEGRGNPVRPTGGPRLPRDGAGSDRAWRKGASHPKTQRSAKPSRRPRGLKAGCRCVRHRPEAPDAATSIRRCAPAGPRHRRSRRRRRGRAAWP